MRAGVLLALAASAFTASASVAQRVAAAPAPGELAFRLRLVTFLLRRPVWFLGILCMIAGFCFQVAALRMASLSLVQPVIATELLLVFAFLALRNPSRVHARDWLAGAAMAGGLAGFLLLAQPSGGGDQASGWSWVLATASVVAAAGLASAAAFAPGRSGRRASPNRRAALLAVSAGIAWGLVAAIIKALSGELSGGISAVLTSWPPYALMVAGAAAMFLASNAFQAGSLAASQPGLTIVDPLVASLLGITLFGEHLRHAPWQLAGEAVALVVVVAGVILLSRSSLVLGPDAERLTPARPEPAPSPTPTPGVRRPPADVDQGRRKDPSGSRR